jgi:oligoribonuclease NrnB/cAMP/cGMP phosphodiesterase (DHH superfamily)
MYVKDMIDSFKKVDEIYCHASCPDGTGSALVCAKVASVVGVFPKIKFIQYGTKEHLELEAKPNQLFVDITPPLNRWQEWQDLGVLVLDHHKTAENATRMLNGVFGNSSQSGTSLAFEYLMYPIRDKIDNYEQWERFAKLCAIRDTWDNKNSEWEQAAALAHGLISIGPEKLLESIDAFNFDLVYQFGKLTVDKIKRKAAVISKTSIVKTEIIGGVECKFAFFNLTDPTFSDISEFLRVDYGFDVAASYFYIHGDRPKTVVSFRSNDKVNVRKVAEKFGGGGHDRAAGCGLNSTPSPDILIDQVMNKFREV